MENQQESENNFSYFMQGSGIMIIILLLIKLLPFIEVHVKMLLR